MRIACFLILCLLAGASPALAEVELRSALSALRASDGTTRAPSALRTRGKYHVSLLIERRHGAEALPPGALPIQGDWFALTTTSEGAEELASTRGDLAFYWTPGRRLLLDRADGWTRASAMRNRSGVTGRGVAIGIVDTGVDVLHADLRNADGTTRVRWLIDFTRPALGRQPSLEEQLGCLISGSECAIYDSSDIDELIANTRGGELPRDPLGHGTHVASLAAGNGLSGADARYIGVAPEADLIVARVTTSGASDILDAEVLRAARFVFERAEDLRVPAVLNLSIGSDFGAHDGTSPLERALSSFVGPREAGRAIVVAAGNSAGLYNDSSQFPQPLGVHSAVHVPPYAPVRVPLLTPNSGKGQLRAGIYVWIGFRRGDDVRVALERDGAELIGEVPSGSGRTYRDAAIEALVLNGVESTDRELQRNAHSAVIFVNGTWQATSRFQIRLNGRGSAALWVQSDGDLDPSRSAGALFPFASKEGTINVPASAPALIAVGATLNRVEWQDHEGNLIRRAQHGWLESAPPDTTAFFSSAGPNAIGVLKPDLVAPGANVAGALSRLSDPRQTGGIGLFAGAGRCADESECYVVDDTHAVSSGTSMAAPLVAGAIALLFERDPTLTQEGVRALLQAGARPLQGVVFADQQTGVGALDLEGALEAQIAETSPVERIPSARSWLKLGASLARPDPEWPLFGYLELRDAEERIADGFDSTRLGVMLSGGRLNQPLTRVAPGLYRFSVTTEAESGGRTLGIEAQFDGRVIASTSVPIAVDRGAASGAISPRGGCGVPKSPGARAVACWTFALFLCGLSGFRARSARGRQIRAR